MGPGLRRDDGDTYERLVIARSEATKQSSLLRDKEVDCFASLAMTILIFGDLSSNIHKPRRALFHVGAYRLELVGPAHQLHLLDGFG
jgi:hypothetical protein